MSFTNKIIEKEGGSCRLITANENGKKCWFLLELDTALYISYKKLMKSGKLNIRDFGSILDSGWGEPNEAMRLKYAA